MKQHVFPVLLTGMMLTTPLHAHSPVPGVASFFNGALHPLFIPAQLLVIIAFALFTGQQGVRENLTGLLSFVTGCVAGLLASQWQPAMDMQSLLLVAAAMLGLLVAANIKQRGMAYWLIAVLCGLFIGLDSSQPEMTGKDLWFALLGTLAGVYLLLLYPMALAEYLRKHAWQQIIVRVAGSWVAASALLVFSLQLLQPASAVQ